MHLKSGFGLILAAALAATAGTATESFAADDGFFLNARGGNGGGGGGKGGGKDGGGDPKPPTGVYYSWMDPGIQGAWSYTLGENVSITVVDDFSSRTRFFGNVGDGLSRARHGEWVYEFATRVAPGASIYTDDVYSDGPVTLQSGSNVINLSYGWVGPSNEVVSWGQQESDIIGYGHGGSAVISKSAGNDGVAIGTPVGGEVDHFALALRGGTSVIFVGALDSNGTTADPASLAYYSNFPGADTVLQNQFVVVGVDSGTTGLAGTSFAAPIVSGYAALVSSKFPGATASQVANQLFSTARTDTIQGYAPSLHGHGEADVFLAVSPQSIN